LREVLDPRLATRLLLDNMEIAVLNEA